MSPIYLSTLKTVVSCILAHLKINIFLKGSIYFSDMHFPANMDANVYKAMLNELMKAFANVDRRIKVFGPEDVTLLDKDRIPTRTTLRKQESFYLKPNLLLLTCAAS